MAGSTILIRFLGAVERLSPVEIPFTDDEQESLVAALREDERADEVFRTLLEDDPDLRAKVQGLLEDDDFREEMGRQARALERLIGKITSPGSGVRTRWEGGGVRSAVPALEAPTAKPAKENPYAPITLRDTDLVNLGLKKPNGEWNLDEVLPEFRDTPEKVRRMLIDRITHPQRSAAKVAALRQPLLDIMEWARNEAKGDREAAVESLRRISQMIGTFDELAYGQVKGVRNWEGGFTYELRMLRDAHYRSSYWRELLPYNRVYPETTVALMRVAQMIVTLQNLHESLPDEGAFKDWKRAIRKALDHPELKPFHERQKFLRAAVEHDNPYVFVDEAGWNSEEGRHIYFDIRYPRGKESDPRDGKKIQAHLRTSGELDDILREFKELANPQTGIFAELWKINVPSAEQVAGRKRAPQSQGTGDKHPFVRQFPDGIMNNILAEMDFTCRAAMAALRAESTFAETTDESGAIKLEAFANPLLEGKNIVPISVDLGGGKKALLLSGPNMGGKTATARSILLAVLLNQAGLPLPASSARLSLFRNIYSVFPRNEQLQEGQGYFGDILKEFVELTANTGEGDLVIIDEVPTGTDYYELVAVTVVLIEDLIKRGATVIVTGHLKKAFELIAARTGQTPYRQTTDESGEPDFRIKEGIAKRSHGIELTRKAYFPPQVTELALAYYRAIMEGTGPETLPSLDIPSTEEKRDASQNLPDLETAVSVLRNIYSEDLFAFSQTPGRIIDSLLLPVENIRAHDEAMGEIANAIAGKGAPEPQPSEGSAGEKAVKIDPPLLEASPPRIGEPQQRLRLTTLLVAQGGPWLENLTGLMVETNRLDEEQTFGWHDPAYEHKKAMGRLAKLDEALRKIIGHLQRLAGNEFVSEEIQTLNRAIEWFGEVKKLFSGEAGVGLDKEKSAEGLFGRLESLETNLHFMAFVKDLKKRRAELERTQSTRKGRVLDQKALQDLHKIWQGVWGPWLARVKSILGPIDELTGSSRAVIKHGLKAPIVTDEAHSFEVRDARPYSTKRGLIGGRGAPPFIKNGVPQTLVMEPQKPVLVVTGPNSSGKSAVMLTAYVEALAATHGFYTSGQVRMSRFDRTFAFFGGSNVTWRGESYFFDILKRYAEMLRQVTPNSLVVLDEMHGTDNFELAAIQLAVLHYLRERNVTVLYNTHIRDGLKLAADRIGLDLRQTDVSFDGGTFTVKPHFTISPDPDLKSQSYGLAIAKQWLTEEQHRRALGIYQELTADGGAGSPGGRGGPAEGHRQEVLPAPEAQRPDEARGSETPQKLQTAVIGIALERGLRSAAGIAARLSDRALASLAERDRLDKVLDKTGYAWAKGGLGPWGKTIQRSDLLLLGLAALSRSDREVALALRKISEEPAAGSAPANTAITLPAPPIGFTARPIVPLLQ